MNFIKFTRYDLYGYLLPGMLLVALPYAVCHCCITKLCSDINSWALAGFYLLISYIIGMFYGKILLNYLNFLPNSNASLRTKQRAWEKSKQDASHYEFADTIIETIETNIDTQGINEIYTKAWTLIENKISDESQAIESQREFIKACTPITGLYSIAFAFKFAFLEAELTYLWITIGTLALGFLMVLTYININENFPRLVWENYLWDLIKKKIEDKQKTSSHNNQITISSLPFKIIIKNDNDNNIS